MMTEKTAVGTTQVFGKDFSNNSGFRLEGAQTSFQRLADETESSCRCQDSPGGGGEGMPRLIHSNDPSKLLPRYNSSEVNAWHHYPRDPVLTPLRLPILFTHVHVQFILLYCGT